MRLAQPADLQALAVQVTGPVCLRTDSSSLGGAGQPGLFELAQVTSGSSHRGPSSAADHWSCRLRRAVGPVVAGLLLL